MTKSILQTPSKAMQRDLLLIHKAVQRAFPLKSKHRSDLMYAVRDLSRQLTSERGQMQSYWSAPRMVSAYLRYFLPWNALRLSWLLPNLPLKLASGMNILDLGSGPLTLPLGLWLSKAETRKMHLNLSCADISPRPLELGKDVLLSLLRGEAETDVHGAVQPEKNGTADNIQAPAWSVKLQRASLEAALKAQHEPLHLVTACNVLNELSGGRSGSLEDRLEDLFSLMDRSLLPGGQIFLMEPGTRLGGKLIASMRNIAIENGYTVLSPCPHQGVCPMHASGKGDELDDEFEMNADFEDITKPASHAAGKFGAGKHADKRKFDGTPTRHGKPEAESRFQHRQRYSGWCHFSCGTEGASPQLLNLSSAADLEKTSLHLSFVLLQKSEEAAGSKISGPQPAHDKGANLPLAVRVVSDPIRITGKTGFARYACSEKGLALLHNAEPYPSGMLVAAQSASPAEYDAKSGALALWPGRPAAKR